MSVGLTFGSVGDIISVCSIIKELITALREFKGSSSEYQTTIRELQNVDTVLTDLHDLACLCDRLGGYESLAQRVRLEALKCESLITPFRDKISKYTESLRIGGCGNVARDAFWKLHWRISHRDDLEEFRRALKVQTEVMTVIIVTAKMYEMIRYLIAV